MPLQRLELTNVRCFENLSIDLPRQLIVVAPNGRGKSTILEAITMLALTRSHRTRSDGELIKTNETAASITGLLGPRQPLRIVISRDRDRVVKQANRLGQIVPLTGLIGMIRVVTFGPEDTELMTGAPRLRRGILDSLLLQRNPTYAQTLLSFHRAVKQRNALLARGGSLDAIRAAITVWDLLFIESASAIIRERQALVAELEIATQTFIGTMQLPFTVSLRYQSSVPDLDRFEDLVAARLERDRDLGSTSVGPHRDDLAVLLNGRAVANASRGEQRALLVALKLAEYERLAAGSTEPPIFLVDDVFSELDPDRRELVATHLVDRPCVITTADKTLIPDQLSSLPIYEL